MVKSFLEMIPLREKYLKAADNIAVYPEVNRKLLWTIYKHIVPFIGRSELSFRMLSQEQQGIINEFRLKSMEEKVHRDVYLQMGGLSFE